MESRERYVTKNWSILLVIGLILMVLGLIVVTLPQLTTFAMFSVIGWVLLLAGCFQLFQLIGANVLLWERLGSSLVLAIFYGLVGLFIILYPQAATQLISTILGLFFFIGGLVKLFIAVQIYPARYWHWLLVTGIVGILIAIYLFVTSAGVEATLLGYLIGFYLMLHGVSLVFYSAALRGLLR